MDAAVQPAPHPVPPRSPTITDVARLAGVAKTTVSYTLNDSGFVSEEKRARILAAIDELGYRPNSNARALRLNAPSRIGIDCSDLTEGWTAQIINGVRAAARTHQLTVVLLEASDREAATPRTSSDVDGVILVRSPHQDDRAVGAAPAGLPHTVVSSTETDGRRDPETIGAAAVNDLIQVISATAQTLGTGSPEPRRHNRATAQP